MAGVHLGHDSQVGDNVVLANNVLLAGHVHVADRAFIGGGCAIHQFCRVGEGAMIGGLARITVDVPPFSMVAERDELAGLNIVGLKRRGCPGKPSANSRKFSGMFFSPRETSGRLLPGHCRKRRRRR